MPSGRNYGLLVESEIINALNNHRYKNLSPNMKTLIRDMFGVVNPLDRIHASKCEDIIKPDIFIRIKKRVRYLSVKSGRANVVHDEIIKNFVLYLREKGMSDMDQKILLLFQYGDGTMDGSGKDRMNYHEVFNWLKEYIKEFNESVNSDHNFIEQVIERCIFQGVDPTASRVDYLYVGDLNYGLAVSRDQIFHHLRIKTWNFYENIHFGPLLIRPHGRYAHRAVVNEKTKNRIEIYWPNLADDVKYIHDRYNDTFNSRNKKK